MFYHDKKLQFPVRVDQPDPVFATMLQQALGGIEGELRVVLQYMLQASTARGPAKYRDLLLEIGAEDMGHLEMYATAIALNLEGSPAAVQEEFARQDAMVAAVMGGMSPRSFLSGGMGALAADSEGNPFNGSWVVNSGNLAADMYANVEGESLNACVASRLFAATDDVGMREMLRYFIARDNLHMQAWLGVLEELGGYQGFLPIPNSYPYSAEQIREFGHTFYSTAVDGIEPPEGRWTSGPSLDGRGEFRAEKLRPMGEEPQLAAPIPQAFAQRDEMRGGEQRVAAHGGGTSSEGIISRLAHAVSDAARGLTGG